MLRVPQWHEVDKYPLKVRKQMQREHIDRINKPIAKAAELRGRVHDKK